MPKLEAGSVNLAILDLPYNISKAGWDKWKKKEDYTEWVGDILLEVQRTLADNGSMYFFHNDMEQVAVIMEWIAKNTNFVFKQFIVWNKRFEGARNKGFLDGFVEVGGLRNYQQMSEYILYYTFQDETGLTTIMPLIMEKFQKYFSDVISSKDFNAIAESLGVTSTAVRHLVDYPTQPSLPNVTT